MERNLESLFQYIQNDLIDVDNKLSSIGELVVMNDLTNHLLRDQISLLKKSFHGLFSELNRKPQTERG